MAKEKKIFKRDNSWQGQQKIHVVAKNLNFYKFLL